MGENIGLRPAHKIKLRTRGQEIKTRLCDFCPVFPIQHRLKRVAQPVQIENIRCRVIDLRLAQRVCPPVARLLLFRDINAKQLLQQSLQPVTTEARRFAMWS